MTRGPRLMRAAWLGWWGAMRRYHRFEVRGLERILAPGAAMIAGYHGRPIAHDLCMLQSLVHAKTGQILPAVMHATAPQLPVLRDLVEGMEFLTGDGPEMAAAVAAGKKIIVTPGGTGEGCRSVRHRYQVAWGKRVGYLRVAARHGLPIVPTAAAGVDACFVGLNNGDALGKRLGVPGRLPVWVGFGPLGLWPLSPPFPVRITLLVGEPIHLGSVDPDDRAALLQWHAVVVGRVQALLDSRRELAA